MKTPLCRCGRDDWKHERLPSNSFDPPCRDYRPMDFSPFMEEADNCCCDLHNAVAYAVGVPLRDWVTPTNALFDALTAGRHVRREWAEWLEIQRSARIGGPR